MPAMRRKLWKMAWRNVHTSQTTHTYKHTNKGTANDPLTTLPIVHNLNQHHPSLTEQNKQHTWSLKEAWEHINTVAIGFFESAGRIQQIFSLQWKKCTLDLPLLHSNLLKPNANIPFIGMRIKWGWLFMLYKLCPVPEGKGSQSLVICVGKYSGGESQQWVL